MSRINTEKQLSLWEEKFPGHGDKIMEILTPFCDEKISFKLQAPSSELEEICRKAIFWQDFGKIVVVAAGDLVAINNRWRSLGSIILGTYGNLVENYIGQELNNSLSKGTLMGMILDKFSISLASDLNSPIEQPLVLGRGAVQKAIIESDLCKSWDALGAPSVLSLMASINYCIFFAVATTVSDLQGKVGSVEFYDFEDKVLNPDFSSLLKLWLTGNIPLGLDNDGNLLVLCAPSSV